MEQPPQVEQPPLETPPASSPPDNPFAGEGNPFAVLRENPTGDNVQQQRPQAAAMTVPYERADEEDPAELCENLPGQEVAGPELRLRVGDNPPEPGAEQLCPVFRFCAVCEFPERMNLTMRGLCSAGNFAPGLPGDF